MRNIILAILLLVNISTFLFKCLVLAKYKIVNLKQVRMTICMKYKNI